MISTETPPFLRTACLHLSYRVQGHLHVPSPAAAVWRGQIGYHLRRLGSEDDHDRDRSLYQQLFRTPRAAVDVPDYEGRLLGALGLAGEHVPHPFLVRPADPPRPPGTDVHRTEGDRVQVEVVLLGTAVRHLPSLTGIAEILGADGLGRRTTQPDGSTARGRVSLTGATLRIGAAEQALYDGTDWTLPAVCGPDLYDRAPPVVESPDADAPPRPLRVRLLTPTRLKHRGEIVRPETMTAGALAANLYRRVAGMVVCYGRDAPPAEAAATWQDATRQLAEETSLDASGTRWIDDTRYSSRQDRRHPAGGLVGTLCLDAPDAARRRWAEWVGRAEPIHLGKATSMGLGRLQLP